MAQSPPVSTRAALSDRLLRFAIERSIETREFERRVAAMAPDAPGHQGMRAALATAKAWESAILWLAWRLQPRSSVTR